MRPNQVRCALGGHKMVMLETVYHNESTKKAQNLFFDSCDDLSRWLCSSKDYAHEVVVRQDHRRKRPLHLLQYVVKNRSFLYGAYYPMLRLDSALLRRDFVRDKGE
jgi:hypothetical protein